MFRFRLSLRYKASDKSDRSVTNDCCCVSLWLLIENIRFKYVQNVFCDLFFVYIAYLL